MFLSIIGKELKKKKRKKSLRGCGTPKTDQSPNPLLGNPTAVIPYSFSHHSARRINTQTQRETLDKRREEKRKNDITLKLCFSFREETERESAAEFTYATTSARHRTIEREIHRLCVCLRPSAETEIEGKRLQEKKVCKFNNREEDLLFSLCSLEGFFVEEERYPSSLNLNFVYHWKFFKGLSYFKA